MRRELSKIAAPNQVDALVLKYEAACRQVHEGIAAGGWPAAAILKLQGLGLRLLSVQLSAWHCDMVSSNAFLIQRVLERVQRKSTEEQIAQIRAILRVNGEIVAKRRGGG
jgi:hypothetical protein